MTLPTVEQITFVKDLLTSARLLQQIEDKFYWRDVHKEPPSKIISKYKEKDILAELQALEEAGVVMERAKPAHENATGVGARSEMRPFSPYDLAAFAILAKSGVLNQTLDINDQRVFSQIFKNELFAQKGAVETDLAACVRVVFKDAHKNGFYNEPVQTSSLSTTSGHHTNNVVSGRQRNDTCCILL